jgi:hypothetical protein
MGRKRRHKPTDPAEAARRDYLDRNNPGAWGVNDGAMKLSQNEDVQDEGATRTKVRRVVRFDCFSILLAREEWRGELVAVRRFQDDMAIMHGVGGGEPRLEVVDNTASADGLRASQLDAGKRLRRVAELAPALHLKLLQNLSVPAVVEGRQVNWKSTVFTTTGAVHPRTQAKYVRDAAASLKDAYHAIDQAPRKAA